MKILALDTSTEYCSVALWLDGAVLSDDCRAGQEHSELLLPMIDRLLRGQGIALAQLDGIAFGAGPGSFTGLRIACGVAQGLALGAGLPVVGVGALEALAASAEGHRVVCCLDARMGEIYHGAYQFQDGAWRPVSEPRLCRPQEVPDLPGRGWTGAGSGFSAHGEILAARYSGRLAEIRAELVPHAREIASLAVPRFAAGAGIDPSGAAPLYVRDKVALTVAER